MKKTNGLESHLDSSKRNIFARASQLVIATLATTQLISATPYKANVPSASYTQQVSVDANGTITLPSLSGKVAPLTLEKNSGKWTTTQDGIYLDPVSNNIFGTSSVNGGTERDDFIEAQKYIFDTLTDLSRMQLREIKKEDIKPGSLLEKSLIEAMDGSMADLNLYRGNFDYFGSPDKIKRFYTKDTSTGKMRMMMMFYNTHLYSALEAIGSTPTPIPNKDLHDYMPEIKSYLTKEKKVITDPLK